MLRRSLLATLVTLPLVASCQSGGSSSSKTPTRRDEDIAGRLVMLGQFKELLKSVQMAGLMGTLQSDGPYTLFAPTDRAFENLDDRDLMKLQQDKERLAYVLKYHLARGSFGRGGFKEKTIKTLAGPSLTIRKMGQVIRVNDQANIETQAVARNGMIHAIDMVLMPPRGS